MPTAPKDADPFVSEGAHDGVEAVALGFALDQALFRQNVVLYNLKAAELGLRLLAGEM